MAKKKPDFDDAQAECPFRCGDCVWYFAGEDEGAGACCNVRSKLFGLEIPADNPAPIEDEWFGYHDEEGELTIVVETECYEDDEGIGGSA